VAFLGAVVAADEAAGKRLKRYSQWQATVCAEEAALKQQQASGSSGSKGQQQQQEAADGTGGEEDERSAAAWRLVARTRAHPKFARWYNFPSYEKGWIRISRLQTTPPTPAAANGASPAPAPAAASPSRPRLLGLDCEMCATTKSSSALLSLAVVDASGAVIMRELVKPAGKVLDLRTQITGITKADLRGVTTKRREVAARLAQMLGPDTILVGHSLSADLTALQVGAAGRAECAGLVCAGCAGCAGRAVGGGSARGE